MKWLPPKASEKSASDSTDDTRAGGDLQGGERAGVAGGRARGRGSALFRLAASLILLAFLLRRIAFSEITGALERAVGNWPFLVVAFTLPLLGIVITALRWRLLMKAQGIRIPVRRVTAAVLVGICFNQILPSTIGGDIARSIWLKRPGQSALGSLAVVTLDRAVGVFSLSLLALACALLSPTIRSLLPTVWLVPVVIAGAGWCGWLVAFRLARRLSRWIESKPWLRRYRSKADLVASTLGAYRGRGTLLLGAIALSLLLQLAIVLQFMALAAALDARVVMWEFALIVPVVTLVTLVPVTINGLGLREGAFALLGAPIALQAGDAVALGWMWLAGTLPYGIAGWILYARGPSATDEEPAASVTDHQPAQLAGESREKSSLSLGSEA